MRTVDHLIRNMIETNNLLKRLIAHEEDQDEIIKAQRKIAANNININKLKQNCMKGVK